MCAMGWLSRVTPPHSFAWRARTRRASRRMLEHGGGRSAHAGRAGARSIRAYTLTASGSARACWRCPRRAADSQGMCCRVGDRGSSSMIRRRAAPLVCARRFERRVKQKTRGRLRSDYRCRVERLDRLLRSRASCPTLCWQVSGTHSCAKYSRNEWSAVGESLGVSSSSTTGVGPLISQSMRWPVIVITRKSALQSEMIVSAPAYCTAFASVDKGHLSPAHGEDPRCKSDCI